MARIQVNGEGYSPASAVISEVTGFMDDEGCYGWACRCGAASERARGLKDAIQDAMVHVDHQCPRRLDLS